MDVIRLALEAAGKVLLVGLTLGAGLPLLFALGVRLMAVGTTSAGEGGHGREISAASSQVMLSRAGAAVLFGVVVLAVLVGIAFVVASGAGYSIDFSGWPSLKEK